MFVKLSFKLWWNGLPVIQCDWSKFHLKKILLQIICVTILIVYWPFVFHFEWLTQVLQYIVCWHSCNKKSAECFRRLGGEKCQKDPLHKCTIFLQQLFSWCRWLGFYLTKSSVWYQIKVHKWSQLWSLRVSPLPLCELLGVWPQSWSWMVWPLTATLHIINLRRLFWRLSSELVLSWNWTTFHHCFVLFIWFARFLSIHVIFLHLISWSLL